MELSLSELVEEVTEHLNEVEQVFLDIEESGETSDRINDLFRHVHTIKSAAGMFEVIPMVKLSHHLEHILDEVRHGDLDLTSEILSLSLQYIDLTRDMLNSLDSIEQYEGAVELFIKKVVSISRKPEGDENREDEEQIDTVRVESVESHTGSDYDPTIITRLHSDTIPFIREQALSAVNNKQPFVIDLSNVVECDNNGIHFLCSLVPLFMRDQIPLTVKSLSKEIVEKGFSIGVHIENVLKRASIVQYRSPGGTKTTEFTITLHQSILCSLAEYEAEQKKLLKLLRSKGEVSTEMTSEKVGDTQSSTTFHHTVICFTTSLPRSEIEQVLEKIPERILWTISITPESPIRHHVGDENDESGSISEVLSNLHIAMEELKMTIEVKCPNEAGPLLQRIEKYRSILRQKGKPTGNIPVGSLLKAYSILCGND